MSANLINIGLAFIEGLALIASPCILPILPIVLAGSLTGSKARPIGIIIGFVASFTFVTLFSKWLVQTLHVDSELMRNISYLFLLMLGLIMLSNTLSEKFSLLTQGLLNTGNTLKNTNDQQSGFWGGILFGCLVGLIWTPCAGPILAAVFIQVVLQESTIGSVLTILAFAIGAGVPMLLIALLGRGVLNQFNFVRAHTLLIRQLLAVIIIASVFLLYFDTNAALFSLRSSSSPKKEAVALINGLNVPYQAPEIVGITEWINSPPLTIKELHGKVVLIDFWTYSCINCLRTLPYLKDWYAKYHDKGLVIIGVHSPEFEFERDSNNVKSSVAKLGITYPVALDNQFQTWRAFYNRYWPAHYLINQDGMVVYTHFGEGEYDVTENNIRFLLGIKEGVVMPDGRMSYTIDQTPETYFGSARLANFESTNLVTGVVADYQYPATLTKHHWGLQGKWLIDAENMTAESANASLKMHFFAKDVFAVMGHSGHPQKIKIYLNGKLINTIFVDKYQLYQIVGLQKAEEGIVEIVVEEPGLKIYTFTFG